MYAKELSHSFIFQTLQIHERDKLMVINLKIITIMKLTFLLVTKYQIDPLV